jgi:hypothetical protein
MLSFWLGFCNYRHQNNHLHEYSPFYAKFKNFILRLVGFQRIAKNSFYNNLAFVKDVASCSAGNEDSLDFFDEGIDLSTSVKEWLNAVNDKTHINNYIAEPNIIITHSPFTSPHPSSSYSSFRICAPRPPN